MKTITITITVPDGVTVEPQVTTTAGNAPQAAAPVQGGPSPVCPRHGAEKVKPSTKFTGYFCTATDESTDRGYCKWQQR